MLKLKPALGIPTAAPITVANNSLEMLPLVADETIKDLQDSQKKQDIY